MAVRVRDPQGNLRCSNVSVELLDEQMNVVATSSTPGIEGTADAATDCVYAPAPPGNKAGKYFVRAKMGAQSTANTPVSLEQGSCGIWITAQVNLTL